MHSANMLLGLALAPLLLLAPQAAQAGSSSVFDGVLGEAKSAQEWIVSLRR